MGITGSDAPLVWVLGAHLGCQGKVPLWPLTSSLLGPPKDRAWDHCSYPHTLYDLAHPLTWFYFITVVTPSCLFTQTKSLTAPGLHRQPDRLSQHPHQDWHLISGSYHSCSTSRSHDLRWADFFLSSRAASPDSASEKSAHSWPDTGVAAQLTLLTQLEFSFN